VQNTAHVYGKKVDFLHEKSLGVVATLTSGPPGGEGGEEEAGGDEAGGPRKRRGAARPDLDFGFIKVEVIKHFDCLQNCIIFMRIRICLSCYCVKFLLCWLTNSCTACRNHLSSCLYHTLIIL
jgi:hypothetical protein